MEKIQITIGPGGEVSYKVEGVKGKGCKKLTAAIDALGTVTETKTTSEYNEIETSSSDRATTRG